MIHFNFVNLIEECTFFVKGEGIGRRLYVLPEYRTEGIHFSLKAWEPDQPDSITFVFTADDGLKSRYILKIGASDNEKVLLYYQSEEEGNLKSYYNNEKLYVNLFLTLSLSF